MENLFQSKHFSLVDSIAVEFGKHRAVFPKRVQLVKQLKWIKTL